MHDSNVMPIAIPIFSVSGNMTALVRILSYIRVSGISNKTGLAAFNRNYI